MASSKAIDTFDVMVNAEKKGVAYDQNPVQIETDAQCKDTLEHLLNKLPLDPYDTSLVKSCLAVVSAQNGDEFTFGPAELVELGQLACKYPEHAHGILACMDHISASLDFEGDVSDDFFAMAAAAHSILGEAISAVAAANLPSGSKPAVTEPSPGTQSATEKVKSFAETMRATYEMMKTQSYIPSDLSFEAFLADMLDEDGDATDDEEGDGNDAEDDSAEEKETGS